jgi:hypothetical protein
MKLKIDQATGDIIYYSPNNKFDHRSWVVELTSGAAAALHHAAHQRKTISAERYMPHGLYGPKDVVRAVAMVAAECARLDAILCEDYPDGDPRVVSMRRRS